MKLAILLSLFLFTAPTLIANTLDVYPSGPYTTLEAAAADARPGDTILFHTGVYAGGEHIEGLQGRADAWITIFARSNGSGEVVIRGGTNAWQLSDAAYVRIEGFVFEGQTGNGLNIDDGGTFDTPAHHLDISLCTWRGIDAEGNNDLLKMSGVDSFTVHDCTFLDGATGGSMIDMVGCHNGVFTGNSFERAGSNCIQSKGGTRYIRIERNRFIDGGQRALNIGGSTDPQFFRPLDANYEASDIRVYSNIFFGSNAPIAFVGAVNSEVVNNTIYLPRQWAIRILQETTRAGFLQCGDNIFRNNIVVVNGNADSPTINVGPNTRSTTFTFSNNLWYNIDDAGWSGPNLPAAESNGIIGSNPMLLGPPTDMRLASSSPAIGKGYPVASPQRDYAGRPFATPRSIGAIEGRDGSASAEDEVSARMSLEIASTATGDHALARFTLARSGSIEISVYDMQGEVRWSHTEMREAGSGMMRIPLVDLPSGVYFCMLRCDGEQLARPIVVRR